MIRITLIAAIGLFPLLTTQAVAQRKSLTESRRAPAAVSLSITGKVGGKSLQASGGGSCRHAPDAAIRGVSASLWMVQYGGGQGGVKQLNLTLWRPKDGSPDQLSLAFETKSGDYRIETGEGEHKGEGAVTILPNGPGGRLELSGKEAGGKPVQITIDCPAFAGIEAEGG
jgi:hypothetical protein